MNKSTAITNIIIKSFIIIYKKASKEFMHNEVSM